MITRKEAEAIAKNFIETMNPDLWDGQGACPDRFDIRTRTYAFHETESLDLSFEKECGRWKCCCHVAGTNLFVESDPINSIEEVAFIILKACGHEGCSQEEMGGLMQRFLEEWEQDGAVSTGTMDALIMELDRIPVKPGGKA